MSSKRRIKSEIFVELRNATKYIMQIEKRKGCGALREETPTRGEIESVCEQLDQEEGERGTSFPPPASSVPDAQSSGGRERWNMRERAGGNIRESEGERERECD